MQHHPATQWRHQLVRAIGERAQDPDVHVAQWLQHGAPMGISKEITPGGLLPELVVDATMTAEEVLELPAWPDNHGSFTAPWSNEAGEPEFPAKDLLAELIRDGFLEVFATQREAEEYFQTQLVPSPPGQRLEAPPRGAPSTG